MKDLHTLPELEILICEWAEQKGLLNRDFAPKQRMKLLEEVGETAGAILKNNTPEIIDGIGDIFVVLVILFKQENRQLYMQQEVDNVSNDMFYIFQAIIDFSSKPQMNGFVIAWLDFVAKRNGMDLTECANSAYNVIKNRTGKLVGGSFIKD